MASPTGYVPAPGETDPQKLARAIRNLYEFLNSGNAFGSSTPCVSLSLVPGNPRPSSEVTGSTSVYVIATGANSTPIYDGTNDVVQPVSASTTLTLTNGAHLAALNYDVFEAWVSGAYVVGTGPTWTNSGGGVSSRGSGAGTTEVTTLHGRRVNANAITLTNGATTYSVAANQANLIGGFKCDLSNNGQTNDSKQYRFVWNEYFPRWRELQRTDAAPSWTYSTASWRVANGSNSNVVAHFSGSDGTNIVLDVVGSVFNSTASLRNMLVGVGINSLTSNSAILMSQGVTDNSRFVALNAKYNGYSAVGYNSYAWLEQGGGADTQTWQGTNVSFCGIIGRVFQ